MQEQETGKNEHIAKLITQFGGQVKLAEKLEVKQGTVTAWLNKKHGICAENAFKIEQLTGGKIKATELCPRLAKIKILSNQ